MLAYRFHQMLAKGQVRSVRLNTVSHWSISSIPDYSPTIPPSLSTLSNGIRVTTENASRTGPVASVSVVIKSGSSHEPSEKNGVANLLQTTLTNSQARKIRLLGGILKGSTTRDETHFSVTCLKDNVAEAVSILGEMTTSAICTEALEKSRKEILNNRLALWNTTNEQVIKDFLYSAAYQNTPMATTAEGEASVIKQLSTNDLESFRGTQYKGCNIVISTVGDVKHDEVLTAATKSFSSLKTGEHVSRYSRVPFTGSQMNIRDDTVHEVQIAIAYETFPYTNEHVLTLALIKEMLGSWQKNSNYGNNASSRLAETLANTNLADEFKVFTQHTQNTGLFGLYARTHDEDSLDDLVYQLFNEFQKLNAYITVDELFRAQNLVS
eukprot:TRINITY_DN3407_c0_g1_i12.p1 TRINITY_DN3407_c0_g1~~TRINITY_DN3407_c0_g1_i12.p1  ORF type:complete len:381 (+),score=54.35 TRINITY_DN3407_c0_g1_i12:114-1256(+)